ncbi:hypothetical protein CCHL11_08981 [Colletotrichum chlorophyti]|uniref:Uncharacterized protein n=1 Tax=Colletotrichum chlorophyti TaxID=708187 RepID=A0A1Q8RWV3_9PEZI|nr:hypothetical protein CCHL11_08981 [Colletotrichum chlorophyti]
MVTNDSGPDFWQVKLPDISSRHPHVLHLILALTALHKSRLCPQQHSECFSQAERHQTVGIRGAIMLLENFRKDDYEIAYVSATLIGLINLAIGPRKGEYIAFSDHDAVNFLGLLRGIQAIQEHGEDAPRRKFAPPIAPGSNWPTLPTLEFQAACHYGEHLERLRHLVEGIHEFELRSSYLAAMDDLEQFFILMDGPNLTRGHGSPQPNVVHHLSTFGWLCRVSDSFLDKLQERESLSLAILACFVVVLKGLEKGWPADGWAEHILSGIWGSLIPEHRAMISWPIYRMKWKPGDESAVSASGGLVATPVSLP